MINLHSNVPVLETEEGPQQPNLLQLVYPQM